MLPADHTTADTEWQSIEACCQSGDVEQAIAKLLVYVDHHPQHVQAHRQLAKLFSDKRDFPRAEQAYRSVLALLPKHSSEYPEVLNHWGWVLRHMMNVSEALSAFDELLKLNPHLEMARFYRGTLLIQMMRLPEALATFDEMLKLDPHLEVARFCRGTVLLQLGRYEEGWRDYESRAFVRPHSVLVPHVPFPCWEGESLAKRSILVLGEQGFGDQIQFVRYLPKLCALGGVVGIYIKTPLLRLIQRLPEISDTFDHIENAKNYDFQIPLLSLPRIFKTTVSTIPSETPYIPLLKHCHKASDHELRRQWQQRVDEAIGKNIKIPKLKVGLVWAGGYRPDNHSAMTMDQRRSLQLSWLKTFVTIPYTQFFSLQYGTCYTAEVERFNQDLWATPLSNVSPIIDLTGYIEDFSDTAALIEHLDLVISCDTAVAHLAGALGIPVWIMNRYDQCWRWLQNRSDSPWYPTAKLFQQPHLDDWEAVIHNISQALHDLTKSMPMLPADHTTADTEWQSIEACCQSGDVEQAIAKLLVYVRHHPQDVKAHYQLGTLFRHQSNFSSAEQAFRNVLALAPKHSPNSAHILNELGWVLRKLARLPEALAAFDEAVKMNPQFEGARANRGLVLLQLGRYEEGWRDYESRLLDCPDMVPQAPFPRWQGQPLAQRSILVLGEQGFGDQIQFVRYLHKLLALLPAVVDVLVKPPLLRLIQRISGIHHVYAYTDNPINYDFQIPLLSLPLIFKTTESTIPAEIPYIPLLKHCHKTAHHELQKQWQQRIDEAMAKTPSVPKLKIGLVWAGGYRPDDHAATSMDQRRSLELEWLTPVVMTPCTQFFSLQCGAKDYSAEIAAFNQHLVNNALPNIAPIIDLTGDIEDFSDTAALIEHLDLVISCDTAVAHLAGALGIPVWIMNRYDQCWRWLQNRSDSPWYPTAQLFQQSQPGHWEWVIQNISQELHHLTKNIA